MWPSKNKVKGRVASRKLWYCHVFVLGNLKEEMVCIQGRGGIRVLSSFCFGFKRRGDLISVMTR